MLPAIEDGETVLGRAAHYRERYVARNERLSREAGEREAELTAKKAALTGVSAVQAAIERARARKAGLGKGSPG